jgi:hypothetical protein
MSFDEMSTFFLGKSSNRATGFPKLPANLSGVDPIRIETSTANPLDKL